MSSARMLHTSALLWNMEDDPQLRSTILAITAFERSPDWEYFRARMDRASRQLPMFRQLVQTPPMRLGSPRLVPAGELDLGYHMRHVRAPEPGTWRSVLDLAQTAEMAPFDRERPLWEFTLVDGLQDGRAVLLTKLHHSLADGIGAMQLAALVVDLGPEMADLGDLPDAAAGGQEGALALIAESLAGDAAEFAHVAAGAARGAAPAALAALRHPRQAASEAASAVMSVARTVQPVRRTLSPLMTGRGLGRRLETLELALGDMRTAGDRLGCSVNDVFLAGVTGGLRRYHEQRGAAVERLLMALPISLRSPDDPVGGNRVTMVRFTVPVSEPDPQARIAEMQRLVREWRQAPSNAMTQGIAFGLNLVPRRYIGEMFKHVDFIASNVPGLDVPVYVAGARVTGYYPFGPTLGSACNITLMSYAGTCFVGVNADTAAVPDLELLVGCLRAEFVEVMRTAQDAGRPGPRRRAKIGGTAA